MNLCSSNEEDINLFRQTVSLMCTKPRLSIAVYLDIYVCITIHVSFNLCITICDCERVSRLSVHLFILSCVESNRTYVYEICASSLFYALPHCTFSLGKMNDSSAPTLLSNCASSTWLLIRSSTRSALQVGLFTAVRWYPIPEDSYCGYCHNEKCKLTVNLKLTEAETVKGEVQCKLLSQGHKPNYLDEICYQESIRI